MTIFGTPILDVARSWQMRLRDLMMGAGTPYRLIPGEPTGLGAAGVTAVDIDRFGADGVLPAGDSLAARSFRARLWILGDSPAHAEQLERDLKRAWRLSRTVDVPLVVRLDGDAVVMWGRPRRCETSTPFGRSSTRQAAVEFVAVDPLIYSVVEVSATIALASGSETPGVEMPIEFDMKFQPDGTPGPGVAFLTNDGSAEAPFRVEVTGPVINPRIENRTTGIDTPFAITLGVDDTLVVDGSPSAPTVTINGTKNLGILGLAPFPVLESGQNEIAYRSDDPSPTASRCSIIWRHTDT